jgi:cation diffusion facilitator family transporter
MAFFNHDCSHPHNTPEIDDHEMSGSPPLRALWRSTGLLLVFSAVEFLAGQSSRSRGLTADSLHNMLDTLSVLPLAFGFWMENRGPSPTFPYGYGKVENLAGLCIVFLISASALATGTGAIEGLFHPQQVQFSAWAMGTALASAAVNLIVARIRIRAGQSSGSESLVADGHHARADAWTALGVFAGLLVSRLGFPRVDSLAGFLITLVLIRLAWISGRSLLVRLLDGIDPGVCEHIRRLISEIPEVKRVGEIRARWTGRRLLVEANVAVSNHLELRSAHAVVREIRHRLLHQLRHLGNIVVHIDPEIECGEEFHAIPLHQHDGLSLHSH